MMHAGIRSTLVYCAVIFALADASSYHRPGDTYPRPPPAPGSPNPGAPNQGSSNERANNNNQNGVFLRIPSPAPAYYPTYTRFPLAPFPQFPQFPSTKRVDSVGANAWSWDWSGTDGVKIVNYQPPSIRWGPSGIRRDSFTQGNPIYIQRPSHVPSVHLDVPDRKVISPIKHLDPPLPTPHDPPTKKTNPTITPGPKTSTRTRTTRPSYSEQQTTENDSRRVSLPVATSPATTTTTEFSAAEITNNTINDYYDETTLAAVDLPLQTSEIELNPTTTRTTTEMDYYEDYDEHVPTPDPE